MKDEKQFDVPGTDGETSVPNPARSPDKRALLALASALVVAGAAFFSGYLTLRGSSGWVGWRQAARHMCWLYTHTLSAYHEKHGVYPETLPPELQYGEDRQKRIVYERTGDGWKVTDYGLDAKPGGRGLDADLVFTNGMNDHEIDRAVYDKKFNATFKQVLENNGGKWFYKSLGTTFVLGIVTYGVAFGIFSGLKKKRRQCSILSMVLIIIAAVVVGEFITMLHFIASGH